MISLNITWSHDINSKIGGYCPSGRGNAAFLSQNNMINKSRELVDGIPPWVTKVILKTKKLNLNDGASLCYKLGQFRYFKVRQILLQVGAAIANLGNRYYKKGSYYKLGQNFLQIRAIITIWRITTFNSSKFTQ